MYEEDCTGMQIKVYLPGESLWLEVIRGDQENGIGKLLNQPICNPGYKWGSLVVYETDVPDQIPVVVELVSLVESTSSF